MLRHHLAAGLAAILIAAGSVMPGNAAAQGQGQGQKFTPKTLAPDVNLVIGSVTARLYGTRPKRSDGLIITPLAESKFAALGSNVHGFYPRIAITRYAVEAAAPQRRFLTVMLYFGDAVGRRTMLAFTAQYAPDTRFKHIILEDIAFETYYAPTPRVALFVLPQAEGADAVAKHGGRFDALLANVSSRAIPVKKPGAAPRGRQPYTVFLFVLDRLSPQSRVAVTVGGRKSGVQIHPYAGWQVVTWNGQLDLGARKPKSLKAVYRPGKDTTYTRRALQTVGLFKLVGK